VFSVLSLLVIVLSVLSLLVIVFSVLSLLVIVLFVLSLLVIVLSVLSLLVIVLSVFFLLVIVLSVLQFMSSGYLFDIIIMLAMNNIPAKNNAYDSDLHDIKMDYKWLINTF
jgi:hypothetical protein